MVLFTTTDLMTVNADQAFALAEDIKSGRLAKLFEARQDDYDAKVAADRQHEEEDEAKAKELAAQIEHAIDSRTSKGVGILSLRSDADQAACIEQRVEPKVLMRALSQQPNMKDQKLTDIIRQAQSFSIDATYVNIKTGRCNVVIADVASLRQIRAALRRDGMNTGTAVAWVDASDLDKARADVAVEQEAKQREQAEAEAEAAKRVVQEKAQEQAAAAQAAQRIAEQQARERAEAAAAAKQAAEQQVREEAAEAEAMKACETDFMQCRDDFIACKNDDLTSQVKPLIEKSTSPLFGQIAVLKMWDFKENPSYGAASSENTLHEVLADREHQCMASMITSRGEMTAYYGWKRIQGDTYISVAARPNGD